jgi:ATP-dependent Clp protease ATP-binding subunit ClpA
MAAREHLAKQGYDPAYGARPLKRLIQREIETRVGRKIVAGEIKDGDRVTVDSKKGEIAVTTG